MRELKFRAWDKVQGKYIEVVRMQFSLARTPILITQELSDKQLLTDPASMYAIEQCTGLRDKNGKEIYEGDIVACKFVYDKRYKCRGLIINREDKACYAIKDIFGLTDEEVELYRLTAQRNLEVIGNIHENPELLKESK